MALATKEPATRVILALFLMVYLDGVSNLTGDTPMNTQERGKQNELEVLKALANCGWMTTRLLALWVWSDSDLHTGINKARQVLARLEAARQVLRRDTLVGAAAWVLTAGGSQRVNDWLLAKGFSRGWAHHGYDLSTRMYAKHLAVIAHLAMKRKDGLAAIGRAGIRAGLVGAEFADFDGVIVEVESRYTKGVLYVSHCHDEIQQRAKRLARICELDMIGEPQLIRRLQKAIGHT